MIEASPEMQKYFQRIQEKVLEGHKLATEARAKGYDPATTVEVKLAANMAERVVGLISAIAPQIAGSGVVERIMELEKEHGALDWRVALKISGEIAQQKFCTFKDQKEAMEIGIRTGFAYVTVGVVSAPLEGFVGIELKKRMDNRGEYVCVNVAGPIRGAGGTGASVCVIIADYIRKLFNYDVYDAQENEIRRAYTEMVDYRERSAVRQYFPSEQEIEFLLKNLPVEIGAVPSEKFEVSNFKDLPRIPTNMVRGGFCLMMTDCIPLKAPKLWKQLNSWGKDFGMEHWNFMEEFLNIQKKSKAKGESKKDETGGSKLSPDYSYLADLVAGRPIFSHPLRSGGFRLRYGRSRTSGYSTDGSHPCTMLVTKDYLATGTQLKTERPKKGCVITACDTVDGPIVKLIDGSVLHIRDPAVYKQVHDKIQEILYLGDLLVNYGDFLNRAHALVPAGYVPEWWVLELKKSAGENSEQIATKTGITAEKIQKILENPLREFPTAEEAITLSKTYNLPLHPEYTYYWTILTHEQLQKLSEWHKKGKQFITEKEIEKTVLPNDEAKRLLETIGTPHTVSIDGHIVLLGGHAKAIALSLDRITTVSADKNVLDTLSASAGITIRDKAGTFIGARMGRPEKAKMRKLTGGPHCLFPVGEEGGRFRSFQSAMEKNKITSDFPKYFCAQCSKHTVLSMCENCDKPTERMWYCKTCATWLKQKTCPAHGETRPCAEQSIGASALVKAVITKLGMRTYPELIKGVKGTSNKEHVPEHIAKGILRAKHEIAVNKDGTIRYDMTQLPITHFKPCEIGTSIEKLKELGYHTDIKGKELVNDDQILELKPQDVLLPDCDVSPDEGAGPVLLRTAAFIDDALVSLYGLKSYYNLQKPTDLVGHLVMALAPHTSAAIVCRIIGFSKTQGFFAPPYIHAATRRDCDGDEACVMLLLDAFLNFSKSYLPNTLGSAMDAPLVLTSVLAPAEVDDMVLDLDVAFQYPLELYEAALQYKMPWEIKIPQIKSRLGKPEQYEGFGFTHDFTNMNDTVRCSAYKTLPSMEEKLLGQMELAEKLRAVDTSDVARLVIEKHFLKDTKGNLRKFGMQEFRCVNCNEKFHRPPLIGKCTECGGKILFTISEGSVVKYLEPTISLAKKYNVSPYLQQTIELLQVRIEGVFGKEREKQTGLGAWFG